MFKLLWQRCSRSPRPCRPSPRPRSRPRTSPAQGRSLIKRYDGSFIVGYERLAFTDFRVPLSPLEATDGRLSA